MHISGIQHLVTLLKAPLAQGVWWHLPSCLAANVFLLSFLQNHMKGPAKVFVTNMKRFCKANYTSFM